MLPVLTVTLNPAIDLTLQLSELRPGDVHRASSVQRQAGGKGINVARLLADWGLPVAATGFLGKGNGAVFREFCAQQGIAEAFVWLPGDTRQGIKAVESGGRTTDLNLPGLAVGQAALDTLRERLATLIAPGQWVVVAGSLPPGLDATAFSGLLHHIRAQGGRLAVDTSGEALRAAAFAEAELLKPNRAELEELAGRSLPTIEAVSAAARELLALGVGAVLVSLGAEGSLLIREDTTHPQSALTVAPIASTTGAGDALLAGYLAGMLEGRPTAASLRLGAAFAACALERVIRGLPERSQVEARAGSCAEPPEQTGNSQTSP